MIKILILNTYLLFYMYSDGKAKIWTNRYEAKTNAGYGTSWIDGEPDGELIVDLDGKLVIPNIVDNQTQY